jgi:arginyl-tRNA synthetase
MEFLETLVASIDPFDFQGSVELRRRPDSVADAAILITNKKWASSSSGRALIDLLSSQREIVSIRGIGQKITLRLADDLIASAGEALEAGDLDTSGLLAGQNYIVDFCDPNATKALHLGHMRNIALGNALAAALRAAGAHVVRQSVICDIGRNVAEAMAGYLQFHNGETPEALGIKPDRYVGNCYAEYVRGLDSADQPDAAAPDAPFARELQAHSDLAEDLLRRWNHGETEARELWKKIRSWALQGQEQTLGRLGITIDTPLYESDVFDTVNLLAAQGLARGIFRRTPDGALVYETGKKEYETVPLIRADNFPTEHMRAAAIWHRLQKPAAELDGILHIMGDEWLAATFYWENILSNFPPCPLYRVYHRIPYGMVFLQGSKMKSSGGEVILIDDLLDRLAESDAVRRLSGPQPLPSADTIARTVALGFFLNRPAAKSIDLSWDRMLDETQNPGWLLSRAWSQACTMAQTRDGDIRGPADVLDPPYRFAVIQSERFRRLLHLTVSNRDVSILMHYLIHLAQWYVATPAGPPLHRVMRTVLESGLCALGCLPRAAGGLGSGAASAPFVDLGEEVFANPA